MNGPMITDSARTNYLTLLFLEQLIIQHLNISVPPILCNVRLLFVANNLGTIDIYITDFFEHPEEFEK